MDTKLKALAVCDIFKNRIRVDCSSLNKRIKETFSDCANGYKATDQHYLDSADDVHGGGERGAGVEQHTDRPAALGPQRPPDHEVRSTRRDHAVRCDRRHGYRG